MSYLATKLFHCRLALSTRRYLGAVGIHTLALPFHALNLATITFDVVLMQNGIIYIVLGRIILSQVDTSVDTFNYERKKKKIFQFIQVHTCTYLYLKMVVSHLYHVSVS